MPNLVDNPLVTESTTGIIEVMDSLGNYAEYPGGGGIAPDNYWYLGGPDYGTFAESGAEWDANGPLGGRSIKLDASDPAVKASGGVTQVVPILQEDGVVKPIKVTAWAKTYEASSNATIQVDTVGWSPDFPGVGSIQLSLPSGTSEYTEYSGTFIPGRAAKYAFLHLLGGWIGTGITWYGGFQIEELDVVIQPPREGNKVHNSVFLYPVGGTAPAMWSCTNAELLEEPSPVSIQVLCIQNGGSATQRKILISPTEVRAWSVGVLANAPSDAVLSYGITSYNSYGQVAGNFYKTVSIESGKWETKYFEFTLPTNCVAVDLTIQSQIGNIKIGEVFITPTTQKPIRAITSPSSAEMTNHTPATCMIETTGYMTLPTETMIGEYTLGVSPTPKKVRVSVAAEPKLKTIMQHLTKEELPILTERKTLLYVAGGEYSTDPWTIEKEPSRLKVGDEQKEGLCRIPYLNVRDDELVTTDGSIPSSVARYYTVTAVTAFGESTPGNEVKFITSEESETNRIPLEIAPVPGAIKYKVYMTETTADPPPEPWPETSDVGDYSSGNHLLLEITQEDLFAAQCLLYDDGSYTLQPGSPPEIHQGRLWDYNRTAGTITFTEEQGDTVTAEIPLPEDIIAIDYVPGQKYTYLATATGVYRHDRILTPETATKVLSQPDIIDFAHKVSGEEWVLLQTGQFMSVDGGTIYGGEKSGCIGLCVVAIAQHEYFVRLDSDGKIDIYDSTGIKRYTRTLPFPVGKPLSLKGLAAWGPLLLIADTTDRSWWVFWLKEDFNIALKQEITWPVLNCQCWGMTGSYIMIYDGEYMLTFRVTPDAHIVEDKVLGLYGRTTYDYYQPRREAISGDAFEPVFPEFYINGDFSAGLAPHINYGKQGAVSDGEFVVSFVPEDIDDWTMLTQNVRVDRPGIYRLKYTKRGVGVTKTVLVNAIGEGIDKWEYVLYKETPEQGSLLINVPEGVTSFEIRFYFGKETTNPCVFAVSDISLQYVYDENQPWGSIAQNGNFNDYTAGKPELWNIVGGGAADTVSSISDPEGGIGKAWQIETPPYIPAQDNWVQFKSDQLPVVPGDTLRASIQAKASINEQADYFLTFYNKEAQQISEDRHTVTVTTDLQEFSFKCNVPGEAAYVVITLPGGSKTEQMAWTYEQAVLDIIEVISLNDCPDPGFETGIPWSQFGTIERTTDSPHSGNYCVRLGNHAELWRVFTYNHQELRDYFVSVYVAGEPCGLNGVVGAIFVYNDGTDSGYMQLTSFDEGFYNYKQFLGSYSPPKTVEYVIVYISHIYNAEGNRIRIDDVNVHSIKETNPVTQLKLSEIRRLNISETTTLVDYTCTLEDAAGEEVELMNEEIQFSISPKGTILSTRNTNTKGTAAFRVQVPYMAGQYTVTARYGEIEAAAQIDIQVPEPKGNIMTLIPVPYTPYRLPCAGRMLLFEIEPPSRKKPLPTCPGRVGAWQVFRPTRYNEHMMLDFDYHISPASPLPLRFQPDNKWWFRRDCYAHLINFYYIDDLSDYPQLSSHTDIHEKRPEWFLTDMLGQNGDPFGDGRHYYNRANQECNAWYTRRAINWTLDSGWDGVYVDDFWGEAFADREGGAQACPLLDYATKLERQVAITGFWNWFKSISHRFGLWLTSNYPYHVPNGNLGFQIIEQPWDGYLREVWGYASDVIGEGYHNLADAKRSIDTLVHWNSLGKFAIVLFRGWAYDIQGRMYSLAKYLMGKGDYVYIWACGYIVSYGWEEGYAPRFYPEWRLRTGAALEPYQESDGLYTREFERCLVVLNANPDKTKQYELPEGTSWTDLWGSPKNGTQTLAPHSGYVFMKGVPIF